jgi:hypothetical protein
MDPRHENAAGFLSVLNNNRVRLDVNLTMRVQSKPHMQFRILQNELMR